MVRSGKRRHVSHLFSNHLFFFRVHHVVRHLFFQMSRGFSESIFFLKKLNVCFRDCILHNRHETFAERDNRSSFLVFFLMDESVVPFGVE